MPGSTGALGDTRVTAAVEAMVPQGPAAPNTLTPNTRRRLQSFTLVAAQLLGKAWPVGF